MTRTSFSSPDPVAPESRGSRRVSTDLRILCPDTPVHAVSSAGAGRWNRNLYRRFQALRDAAGTRRSHYFQGRFENVYPDRAAIPEVEPVLDWATRFACQICCEPALRCGFWFNEMARGQGTGLHTHDGDDETLSAVYYVTVPEGSGALLLHTRGGAMRVAPQPGLLVFFPPDVPHEVEPHTGRGVRLSLAMNFGPAP